MKQPARRVLTLVAAGTLLVAASPDGDAWTETLIEAARSACSSGPYKRALRKLDEAQSRSEPDSRYQAQAIEIRALALAGLGRAAEAEAHEDSISSMSVITASHPLLASLIIEAIAEYRVIRPPESGPALGCLWFGRKFDYGPDPNPPRFFHHP